MAKILFAIELGENENIDEIVGKLKYDIAAEHDLDNYKFNDSETLLTMSDIKKYLGVGNDTVHSLFNDSDFPSYRVNNRYFIRKDKFLEYVDRKFGKKKLMKIK